MRGFRAAAQETEATTTERPTLRSVAPDWADMIDRWAELTVRENEIQAELLPLNERVRKLGGESTWAAQTAAGARQKEQPDPPAKVVSLLGRLLPEKKPPEPVKTVAWLADKDRATALSDELEAIRQAKDLLGPAIAAAHLRGSRELCAQLRPEYQAVVGKCCEAAIALGTGWLEHQRWVKELRMQGAAFASLKIVFGIEDLLPWQLLHTLDWAVEAGHFPVEKVPHELRQWRQKNGGKY
jgi:hypothetical protein